MKLRPNIQRELFQLCAKTGYINVLALPLYGRSPELTGAAERSIAEGPLISFFRQAAEVRAYEWTRESVKAWLDCALLQRKNKHLTFRSDAIAQREDWESFWIGTNGRRPTVVFFFEGKLKPDELVNRFYDPTCVTNIGVVASKSAIRAARNQVKSGGGRWAIMIPSNSGIDLVSVFLRNPADDEELKSIVEACQFSGHYVKMYCCQL
jgi:hypothetical protein